MLRGKRFWTAVATWIQSSSADAAAPRSCGKRPLPLGSTSFRPAPPRADGAASGPGPPGLAARRRRPAEAAQHRAVLTRRPNPPRPDSPPEPDLRIAVHRAGTARCCAASGSGPPSPLGFNPLRPTPPHPARAASGRCRSDLLHSGLHRRAPMERRAGRGRRRCSDLLRSGLHCPSLTCALQTNFKLSALFIQCCYNAYP